MPTNLKLTPLTNRKSSMTTDIEYESYSKDTDIDMNEKVDTQKMSAINATLTLN